MKIIKIILAVPAVIFFIACAIAITLGIKLLELLFGELKADTFQNNNKVWG